MTVPAQTAGGTSRSRLESALAGEPVSHPVYAVYDWFVENRGIDWRSLFELGLGQIHHATVVEQTRPHLEIVETRTRDAVGRLRRDVRWITDKGELHEWYLGEWRQEYLIKEPDDYPVMACALSEIEVRPAPEAYRDRAAQLGEQGIVLGVPALRRTAFQSIQIDFAGLERFSLDLAAGDPGLFELMELLNDATLREFEAITLVPARHIKLWENLSIETMGPRRYREHLAPVYRRILDILGRSGQRLHVHYDGNLKQVREQIRDLPLDGIDSFTEPPEGDMTVEEARRFWPDKFLWLHPNLGWYHRSEEELVAGIERICRAAGPNRYCLMISEEVPPDWERTVPLVLRTLAAFPDLP